MIKINYEGQEGYFLTIQERKQIEDSLILNDHLIGEFIKKNPNNKE